MENKEKLFASFKTALRAIEPEELLRERLQKIPASGRLIVVGGGKAAARMAETIEEFFFDRIHAGCVAVKPGYGLALRKIEVIESGHPFPNAKSVEAAKKILELLKGLDSQDVVVALISGGASALLALPKQGSIEEFARENEKLLRSGLAIGEINRRRRELLQLADGGLAKAAAPAKVIAFVLSDVIGNDLRTIGSGPTVVSSNDADRVRNFLIGDNALALGGAMRGVARFGYKAQMFEESLAGEAALAGKSFAKRLAAMEIQTALVGGGETTVTLSDAHGLGGRCQESALAAAIEVEGKSGLSLLFASTDGSDGPTDAAGAFVDGTTLARAKKLGLDANDFLKRHDAYHFFSKLGDLFVTGPTLTNVADLAIGIRDPKL